MRRSILYCGLFLLLISLPWPASASWTSPWHDAANTNSINVQPKSNFIQYFQLTNQYITPIIEQDLLITAMSTGNARFIIATNLKTKQEAWRYGLGSSYPRGISIANQTLYINLSTKATIIAVNLFTGQELWQHSFTGERTLRYAPTIYDQEIYVAANKLYKLDQFGVERWAKNFDVSSQPAIDDSGVYFRAHNLSIYRLMRDTGDVVWRQNIDTTEGTQVVLSDSLVFSGTNQAIIAIDKATGQRIWTHLAGDGHKTTSDIAFTGNLLIFSSSFGDLTALSTDGKVIWSQRLNTSNTGGNGWVNEFLISDKVIITRSLANQVSFLDLASGSSLNQFTSPPGVDTPIAIDPPYLISIKDTVLTIFTASEWSEFEQPNESPEKTPLLIIPGLLESWPINRVWQLDPFIGIYTTLFKTLHAVGYQDNVSLFTFPYDWHESNSVTAELLAKKIASIKEMTHVQKVDVVTHSMGGLVAAAYVQSNYYLNDINNLITIATPYNGAVKAYLTWEAGLVGNGSLDGLKELFIRYEAAKRGYLTNVAAYVQRYFPAARDLLPRFDYLVKDRLIPYSPCSESDQPCNPFLETLAANRDQLTSRVKLLNVIGDNDNSSTLSQLIVNRSLDGERWHHGMPLDYPKTTGLRLDQGDGTVLTTSAHLDGTTELTIQADHTAIVGQAAQIVAKHLTDQAPNIPVEAPASRFLFIKAFSPIDLLVTDGFHQTGYVTTTKAITTEIPQSFYSGNLDDEEYIIIANPQENNEYTLNLIGTDSGDYAVEVSYITENDSFTSRVTDAIKTNKVHSYTFNVTKDKVVITDLSPTSFTPSPAKSSPPSTKVSLASKTPSPSVPLPKTVRYPVAQTAAQPPVDSKLTKSSYPLNGSPNTSGLQTPATPHVFSAPIASPSTSLDKTVPHAVKGLTRALPRSIIILISLLVLTCASGLTVILISYHELRQVKVPYPTK